MHLRHFFCQTVNSSKMEICLSLQPLIDSFRERFISRTADRRPENTATWHYNVKMNTRKDCSFYW